MEKNGNQCIGTDEFWSKRNFDYFTVFPVQLQFISEMNSNITF